MYAFILRCQLWSGFWYSLDSRTQKSGLGLRVAPGLRTSSNFGERDLRSSNRTKACLSSVFRSHLLFPFSSFPKATRTCSLLRSQFFLLCSWQLLTIFSCNLVQERFPVILYPLVVTKDLSWLRGSHSSSNALCIVLVSWISFHLRSFQCKVLLTAFSSLFCRIFYHLWKLILNKASQKFWLFFGPLEDHKTELFEAEPLEHAFLPRSGRNQLRNKFPVAFVLQ